MNNRKILWIEDEAEIIESVVKPLKRDGFEIDVVDSVVAMIRNETEFDAYCLVLLDLIIPQKTDGEHLSHPGLEALRIIREDWGSKIPVVALTVVRKEAALEDLARLGVKSVLHKPVAQEVLREAAYAALGEQPPDDSDEKGA